jgi:hypothetical protein
MGESKFRAKRPPRTGEEVKKKFQKTTDEQQYSNGALIQLCVVHELHHSRSEPSVEAITIFNGMAVCRKHLDEIRLAVEEGTSLEVIMRDAVRREDEIFD